jgi:cytochrome bd-type quinol oxidase subunit 2
MSLTGVGLAIIGGSSLGMLALGLAVAAVAAGLAMLAWRCIRPLAMARPATAQWWKFLTAGVAVLAAVIVITTATGEVDGSMWWPMMISVVCALMLVATGLVLGVAHLARNRPAMCRADLSIPVATAPMRAQRVGHGRLPGLSG